MTTLATYWSMTINNPDETDMVLIRNPNDRYVRHLAWSPEEGEDGTPHIQGWLRLQRNNSLAFVKKLYPRAHFRHILKDEYNENTNRYAQKDDATTRGQHHISLNDPIPNNDSTLYKVLERMVEGVRFEKWSCDWTDKDMLRRSERVECEMVEEVAGLEKVFVSAAYAKMKLRFWRNTVTRIVNAREAQRVSVPVINADDHTTEDGSVEEGGLREARRKEDESISSESEGSDDGEGSDEDSESSSGQED